MSLESRILSIFYNVILCPSSYQWYFRGLFSSGWCFSPSFFFLVVLLVILLSSDILGHLSSSQWYFWPSFLFPCDNCWLSIYSKTGDSHVGTPHFGNSYSVPQKKQLLNTETSLGFSFFGVEGGGSNGDRQPILCATVR